MFIFEWLADYMNTPKMEMTGDIELLGILAIGIIAFLLIGLLIGMSLLIDYIIKLVKVVKKRKEKQNESS